MSLSPDLIAPEARWLADRYEFLAELGRGGMAVVYLGRERATGQEVAIKLVAGGQGTDDEAVRRFAREASTVAGLQHPNVVRTLGVEELDGRAFAIISQYVRGRTLRAVLRAAGAVPFDSATRVLRDVAAGLAHAHAARIVHRDVKPENIFLEDATDRALLADFGIARPLDTDVELTMVGASIGTPTYMAPEQVDGRAADERADVYALGLVGWEMLSGRRPWQGETLYAVLHKQKHEPLPSLAALRPDIPAYLLAAIDGALAKAPGDRWRDASEFLDRLSPTPLVLEAAQTNTLADATTMRRVMPAPTDVVIEPEPLAEATPAAAPLAPVERAPTQHVPRAPRSTPTGTRGGRRAPIAVALAGAAALALLLTRERGEGRAAERAVAPTPVAETRDRGLDSLLAVAAGRPWVDSSARPTTPDSAARAGVSRTVGTATGDVRLGTPNVGRAAPAPATPAPLPVPAATRGTTRGSTSGAPAARESATAAPARTAAIVPPNTPSDTSVEPAASATPTTRSATTLDARCRSAAADDQRLCLLGRLESADAQMTRVYQDVIAGYRRAAGGAREPATVRALRAEQRQWLVSRDRLCRARTRGREGPLWGAARVPCFAEMATLRTNALASRLPGSAAAPRRRVGTGDLL